MNQEEDEDAFLYGEPEGAAAAGHASALPPAADHEMEPASEEGEVDDDDLDDESDSDIELIIETEPGKRAAPPPSAPPFAHRGGITAQTRSAPTPEKATSTANQIKPETSSAGPSKRAEGVEIDKVAEYNGQPLFNVELESLEEKPWRKPGADASDYFNYGFDEFTWAAYCTKQTNIRKDFNPGNVMAMMTGMPPEMQAMMSQFPMPPEMMFGGMPGMMPDPNAFGQFPPGGGFQQAPTGPSGQQNFGGGFGNYGGQQQPQQQQQQLQPPKYHTQRMGSPGRMGSPNTGMNIPSGPQAMGGQQGYRNNGGGSMRGAPRGGPRRY